MPQVYQRRISISFHLKFVHEDMSVMNPDILTPGNIGSISNKLESDFSLDIKSFIDSPENGFMVDRYNEPNVAILRNDNEFDIRIEQTVRYNDTFDYEEFLDADKEKLEIMLQNYNIDYFQAPDGTYFRYNVDDIHVDMGVEDQVQNHQGGKRQSKSRRRRNVRVTHRRRTQRNRRNRRYNRKY